MLTPFMKTRAVQDTKHAITKYKPALLIVLVTAVSVLLTCVVPLVGVVLALASLFTRQVSSGYAIAGAVFYYVCYAIPVVGQVLALINLVVGLAWAVIAITVIATSDETPTTNTEEI